MVFGLIPILFQYKGFSFFGANATIQLTNQDDSMKEWCIRVNSSKSRRGLVDSVLAY